MDTKRGQDWDDEEFCSLYESTWEISTDEVHYGWLAPGEATLRLLGESGLAGAKILDLGCGLGQNLIALAKQEAQAVGLDISRGMVRRAISLVQGSGLEQSIEVRQGDMRDPRNFDRDGSFDIVLSVYSMEYLTTIRELRKLLYSVHKKLKPGGSFIFCFSHPSQASRYPELMNRSIPLGAGRYRTFNYSFRDVTDAVFKSGFTIERVVEQCTESPSALSYEDSLKFPYHFRPGKNPCMPDFDHLSNGAPHTVVYKVCRHHDAGHGLPRRVDRQMGCKEIWGYKRTIIKTHPIKYLGLPFDALYFSPMDNVAGMVEVLKFSVTAYDVANEVGNIWIDISGSNQSYQLEGNSILGLIHRKLGGLGLESIYKDSVVTCEEDEFERRFYLVDIAGLGDAVRNTFNTARVGLLVFVNGIEPVKGELPVDQVLASQGDLVSLVYVAVDGRRGSAEGNFQLKLGI